MANYDDDDDDDDDNDYDGDDYNDDDDDAGGDDGFDLQDLHHRNLVAKSNKSSKKCSHNALFSHRSSWRPSPQRTL